MPLDFVTLSSEIRAMSGALRDDLLTLPQRLAVMRDRLMAEAAEWEYWHETVEEASATAAWLTAQPLERFDVTHDLPACPPSYTVAASDGSQLDVDHHGIAACYVINVGIAVLQYGSGAAFRAHSQPQLGYRDNDLYIRDERSGREWLVEGNLLAAQRDIAEGLQLAAAAMELSDDRPRFALQDGTLIRWTLLGFDPFVRDRFMQDYLSYLETMRALDCPVASYISRPRARDVVGLARLALVNGDYNRWRTLYADRSVDPARGLSDLLLFDHLRDGQRSARWASMSKINVDLYGPHRVQFFYLRVGGELARVEFPAWVAERGQIDLLHTIVYDQCQRGLGYPNVLARAHEQAVIHTDERRQIHSLIERLLIQAGVTPRRSAKSSSKLRPGA